MIDGLERQAMSWALSFPPRKWQETGLSKWSENGLRGICKVVTGGGKTFFGMMCILRLLEEKPDSRVLIIVPTLALRDQWVLDIEEGIGASSDEIYSHGSDRKLLDGHRIAVMVINSARKEAEKISSEGEWMLIVDECHRAASEENRKSMRGNWIATLGLSATPERQYDEWFEEFLIPNLGSIIAEYDYVQAKKDGVIVDFELRNYKVPLTESEESRMTDLSRKIAIERRRLTSQGLQTSDQLLNLLMQRSRTSQKAENRIPMAIAICREHIGRRILVFHEYIEPADQLVRILDEYGFRVAAYHSKVGDQLRLTNLKMYRDGLIDVLVTCRALDEGLNVPNTEVGMIVSSTKSTRQRIQRMGRILRTAENKDLGVIISLFTSHEQEKMVEESTLLEEVSEVKWFGV